MLGITTHAGSTALSHVPPALGLQKAYLTRENPKGTNVPSKLFRIVLNTLFTRLSSFPEGSPDIHLLPHMTGVQQQSQLKYRNNSAKTAPFIAQP